MPKEASRGCPEVDMSSYTNGSLASMLEAGIKSHHLLETRFRKLCRAVVQLGAEKEGRGNKPIQQAYISADKSRCRRRASGAQKQRYEDAFSSSDSASYTDLTLASTRGDATRDRSPFRQALDEAKEALADVRGERRRVVTASARASPAWRTHFSVQDESAKVSVAYKETEQASCSPAKLGSSGKGFSARKLDWNGKGAASPGVKAARSRRRAEDGDGASRYPKSSPGEDRVFNEGREPRTAGPRRAKTVSIEAKRDGSSGQGLEICFQLSKGRESRASNEVRDTGNEDRSTGRTSRRKETATIRRAPSQQGLKKENPTDQQQLKQRRETRGNEPPEERRSTQNLGRQRAGGEKCFDDTHEAVEDAHLADEVNNNGCYGGCNRKCFEDTRAEETEEDPADQRRWRRRGRVLWSTHAEPAARAATVGTRRTTVRPHSQPAVRPYHGLYARSLRANGIDPTNFRTSRCCCGSDAALDCVVHERHIDGSLLWRGNRGRGLAPERARKPVDGLPDRLEAGRILDSFNRRAELLGTMSPTLLRAKAAWMENPGDPAYSLEESTEGLLSSFCEIPSSTSNSLRAARADRRFAGYSLSVGKPYVEPTHAAATTLLTAASAWDTSFGHLPIQNRPEARGRAGEETMRANIRAGRTRGRARSSCLCDRHVVSASSPCANPRRRRSRASSVGGAARFIASGD